MRKITVKNIIIFRKKTDKTKKTFLKTLEKVKAGDTESGGNYWVRSISAINNAFKTNNNQIIREKIEDITDDLNITKRTQTKDMYQRNLAILHNYEDFDFSTWYPNKTFKILDKSNKKSVIEIGHIPIQILPNQVFSFSRGKIDYVGAVWFVAKLDGYTKAELGIFAETLFYYLNHNYAKGYEISPEYCLIVDVLNLEKITYQMLLDKKIPSVLKGTLSSIRENLRM
ncbi:MAG: hypothetical protein ACK5OP_07210 [Sphingobacteriales bacterium]|jgi:hypothetical protein